MNEEKFTGRAGCYASFRPAYPEELYAFLFHDLGFVKDAVVADVGAGTGIFSRPLARHGCRVLAVEPNRDMRAAACREDSGPATFTVVDGTAEHTGLPGASVSRVTAAQAFHWFDPGRFAEECRRILRPDGLVVIVYNHRLPDDPVTRDLLAVNRKHCPAFTGFSGGCGSAESHSPRRFFRDGKWSVREFPHAAPLDADGFAGRAFSSSYAPKADSPGYHAYAADLRAVFQRHARDGIVDARLVSSVAWGAV